MHLFKNAGRTTKRLTALLLAFSIVGAATFVSAAKIMLADNSTFPENNATPKYYNALANFSSTDNYEGSGNIFGYQFKTDNNYDEWQYLDYCRLGSYWYNNERLYREDFPSITDEQWNAMCGNKNYYDATWMLAISSNRYMHLRNYKNCMANLPTVPAVAYLFTADIDGYVNIPAGSITLFTTKIAEKGYKALLRITKNGENVYPTSGYMELDDNRAASYPDLDFEVNKGDKIRFELTANVVPNLNSDDSIWVKWNPYISIRGEQYLYTETDDIYNGLTSYMNDYFSNQTSGSMSATSALELATENSKRSKYGVYTALDSVYSGGVIPSGDDAVWKYAVADKVTAGFSIPQADYGIGCVATENGITISWDVVNTNGLDALKAVYDGKSYTYIIPQNSSSITLPISAQGDIKLQLNGKNGNSEIVSFDSQQLTVLANADTKNSISYLTSVTKEGTGISSAYVLGGKSDSNYKIYYSSADVKSAAAAESYRRSIIFNAADGEAMMLGFTAVSDGEYEIAAPIEAESASETYYSVIKQDLSGGFTVVDGIKKYSEDKNGFATTLSLKANETVWLNAYSAATAQINVGVPRVTYKPSVTDNDGVKAYKYRAVDYIENNAFNNISYSSASLTNKEGAVWEFGTFQNPIKTVDGVTDYDTLGYTDLKSGDDASKITAICKPYEILRGNRWYNSLAMVVKADNSIYATHANGVAGTLHTTLGINYNARNNVGLPYLSKGFMVAVGVGTGIDGIERNMGIYMKFTAPTSGNATLNLSDFAEATTATRVVVLKGDEVIKTYASIIPMGETVNLGYMDKGENVYICYGVGAKSKAYNYGGFPIVTLSGEKSTFSFNTNFASADNGIDCLVTNKTAFTLPDYSYTIGKNVIGWYEQGGAYYSAGKKYIVESDRVFNPASRFYGDATGDGNINAKDISAIRKRLLKGNNDLLKICDITSDKKFNLKDLVRMKKWLAGYAVPFCQE